MMKVTYSMSILFLTFLLWVLGNKLRYKYKWELPMLKKYSKKPLININIHIENSQESTVIKRNTIELRVWIQN